MKYIGDRKRLNANQCNWKKTIAEWLASKQPARTFCRERNLNGSTFYYWRARFDPDYQSRNKRLRFRGSPQAFIPVVVENPKSPRSTGIKFYYPNGCFMLLEEGCDLRLFQTVFEATRTTLCS
jgi:hypothetical protein